MIRALGIATVLTLVAISTVNAIAGSRSRQGAAAPRALGRGVSLAIDEVHREPAGETEGLIETHITLSNDGATALKIDYLTFSLSCAAGGRSLALLPSELKRRVASPLLLREGVLPRGQKLVAVLYFRAPSRDSRPIDFRVDLVAASGQVVSRSFLPLALN
ncbi:MAG TPA: hypothetical protein VH853_13530 [Polyangia bacterium]|nr:hypothetical protein [Polyangia bacterium]